jgi:hypothetical protein
MSTGPGYRDRAGSRTALRVLGFLCAGLGLVLVVSGFASVASSMNNPPFEPQPTPTIWPAFVGMPLLGLGIVLLAIGFLGAGARFVSSEVAPSLNRGSAALGFGGPAAPACPACGGSNPAGGAFCQSCGAPLNRVCASCQRANDATARFCAGCGRPISG